MNMFEEAFGEVERAADTTLASTNALLRQAKELQKAARTGNIAAMKRAQERLDDTLSAVRQATANAMAAWPYSDEEAEGHLRDGYRQEFQRVASEKGLNVFERDGRLIAHPSMVRVVPGERAVVIDRKQTSTIRPSHLVGMLLAGQKRRAPHQSGQFLEAMYAVYRDCMVDRSQQRRMGGQDAAGVMQLEDVYKRMTYLPGSSREFERSDFARALYELDANGPKTTRSGATVSFSASTAARSSRGLFTFVGPDGQDVQYYGIQFREKE